MDSEFEQGDRDQKEPLYMKQPRRWQDPLTYHLCKTACTQMYLHICDYDYALACLTMLAEFVHVSNKS